MWSTLSDQTVYFLWSIALGAALGVVYDLVRAVRMVSRARGAGLVISDILFFVLCGIVTSLFALPFNKGGVRGFVMLGEAAGFLCWRLLPGSIMGKIYSHLAGILRKFSQKTHKIFEKTFIFLLKLTGRLLYNIHVLIYRLKGLAARAVKQRKKEIPDVRKKSKKRNKGRKARGQEC